MPPKYSANKFTGRGIICESLHPKIAFARFLHPKIARRLNIVMILRSKNAF